MDFEPTFRAKLLTKIVFAWAILIALRLVQLQVLQHDMYLQMALSQQQRMVEIAAPRGAILDRNGERLAMSVPCQSVCVNPMRIRDLAVAADILARILNLDSTRLYGQMRLANDNNSGFMWIKRKISDEEFERLRDLKLEWIEFRTESKRVYAYGGLAAHVLGGVDFEEKGNAGIEQALDEQLAGHTGTVRVTTDVQQKGYDSQLDLPPEPGKTLRLTILSRLQFVAERELKKAVEYHKCKSGSLVAMDPNTGEILALANYPTYDPNLRAKKGEDIRDRENLAVVAPFEPGSVFKVITLSAALETTNLRPQSIINCGNGSITLFGRTIHDHSSYASLPMEDVLARSSNIGAINVGLKVGDANMYEYVHRFGFGKKTGIQLPAEEPGMLRRLKAWSKSSIGSIAMGHEVSVTSVQLAQAISIIANGGYLVRPNLVLGSNTDRPVRVLRPETAITMHSMMEGVVIKPYGTGHRYTRIPGYTSAGKTGTAQIYDFAHHVYTHNYNASFAGFAPVTNPAVVVVVTVHGATGEASYGGPSAGPVFREVAAEALRLRDIPKDLPDEEEDDSLPRIAESKSKADANDVALTDLVSSTTRPLAGTDETASGQRIFLAVTSSKTAATKNASTQTEDSQADGESVEPTYIGPRAPRLLGMTMRDVVELSSQRDIPVEFVSRGTGLVRAQDPLPGEPLPPGQHIQISLGR